MLKGAWFEHDLHAWCATQRGGLCGAESGEVPPLRGGYGDVFIAVPVVLEVALCDV